MAQKNDYLTFITLNGNNEIIGGNGIHRLLCWARLYCTVN